MTGAKTLLAVVFVCVVLGGFQSDSFKDYLFGALLGANLTVAALTVLRDWVEGERR